MKTTNFKCYGLLVGFLVSILLTCDALSFKVISLFGHDVAVTGILFSLSFPVAAIATEVYGYHLAVRIVWIQICSQAFFIILISLIIRISSSHDPMSALYFDLYGGLWRVLLASTTAVPIAYFINDLLMSVIKIYTKGNLFVSRILVSNIVGAAVLVTISYPINYYHIFPIKHIAEIAFNTWVFKIAIAAIALPFTVIASRLLKRVEKLDYYDYGISYNPMKAFNTDEKGKNLWKDEK